MPIASRSPPIFETEADFAEVLAPDAVAIPSHNLNPFSPEGERVVHFDFKFSFSGGTVDCSGFSAGNPNWVERLAGSRSRRLCMRVMRYKVSGRNQLACTGLN